MYKTNGQSPKPQTLNSKAQNSADVNNSSRVLGYSI